MSAAEKYTKLNTEKIPAVYEAGYEKGKNAEWSAFWDSVQQNGERRYYNEAFVNDCGVWNKVTFKPKYDLICTHSNKMFYGYNSDKEPFSLVDWLERAGVTLDTSESVDLGSMFGYNRVITEVPAIDMSNAASTSGIFNYCSSLVTIQKLVMSPKNILTNAFNRCTSLENLTVEGTIGQNGLNVQTCPLTHDSIMTIINALEDKTEDTSTVWTVTLGSTNKAKLTSDELLIAENKGWQVT